MSQEHPLVDGVFRYLILGPPLRLVSRLKVSGLEHIPKSGGAIIASNHLSFSDSMLLPLAARRPVAFLGKAEYFTGRGIRGAVISSFMRAMGTIPVDRGSGRAALAALDVSERALLEGRLFGIYPEGTRSPDGRLYRGRNGAARLVVSTGVPVIPCGVIGTDKVQPPGSKMIRPGQVRVAFGPPLDFSGHPATMPKVPRLRAMTEDIMAAIRELSGQEYVDSYAPKRPTDDED